MQHSFFQSRKGHLHLLRRSLRPGLWLVCLVAAEDEPRPAAPKQGEGGKTPNTRTLNPFAPAKRGESLSEGIRFVTDS